MSNVKFLMVLLAACAGCSGGDMNPSSPSKEPTRVAGTWDAHFSGTLQGREIPQTDDFVMELHQQGASVSGALAYRWSTVPLPLSGTVEESRLTFNASAVLAPNCEGTVRGVMVIDGGRMSGSQTQVTCEGVASGQTTAIRR